jgi:tRNA nucleotidyltransferase (CCA-adding enzyme)
MQLFQVGGAVRDRLLGIEVYDRDWVVVGADAEQMLAQGFQPVGKDFPVFLHPDTHEEYALARTERKSGRGYGGFQFYADPSVTLEQDLLRRDLTINAMAQDEQGRLIDPYGGQQDLKQRLLRHVSPAFAEDPLRVLRVARFLARFHHLGFRIHPDTLALMSQLSQGDELLALSAERVWKETERALAEPNPEQYFACLQQCGALKQLMAALDQRDQDGALQPLVDACRLSDSVPLRWSVVCRSVSDEATLEQLQQQLKAPKRYRDSALLLWRYSALLNQPLTATGLMQLYQGLDLQRRPERLELFLTGCKALAGLSPDQPYPIADLVQHSIEQINLIEPRTLVAEGFKGAALGQELQQRRQQALEQLLTDD